MRRVVNVSLAVLIGYLSIPVVLNLLSSRQMMNTSFEPLRIVNTYGAFGRCSIVRGSLGLEGTSVDPSNIPQQYNYLSSALPRSVQK